jgi:protein-L-isoaspartate(D-aspartate) O-methyltransferase
MTDLDRRRRFFAEELEAVCRLQSAPVVDAFAAIPRERFLRPGPWTVLVENIYTPGAGLGTHMTRDADPARVYHNIAVAIDPARQLFNGQPGTLASWMERLALAPGMRVLHVGSGLGYYTAILAHAVGSSGRVVAFEIDSELAAAARSNLAPFPWVDLRQDDASRVDGETFDAILVNAGVTHPLDAWLDALAVRGRMIVPLTSAMPVMGTTLGKGLGFVITREDDFRFAANVMSFVAIYSAVGLRDDALDQALGKAMTGGPARWQAVTRLRRDRHEPSSTCWFHAPNCCLSVPE